MPWNTPSLNRRKRRFHEIRALQKCINCALHESVRNAGQGATSPEKTARHLQDIQEFEGHGILRNTTIPRDPSVTKVSELCFACKCGKCRKDATSQEKAVILKRFSTSLCSTFINIYQTKMYYSKLHIITLLLIMWAFL